MADWPLGSGQRAATGSSGATSGVTLTSSGIAHVKGAYVEVFTTTAFESHFAIVAFGWSNHTATHLVHIAIGPAGSEQIVISDLFLITDTQRNSCQYHIPITIPAGVRLAARLQSGAGSTTFQLSVTLVGNTSASPLSSDRVTAYGVVNSGATDALTLPAPASAGVKGA